MKIPRIGPRLFVVVIAVGGTLTTLVAVFAPVFGFGFVSLGSKLLLAGICAAALAIVLAAMVPVGRNTETQADSERK